MPLKSLRSTLFVIRIPGSRNRRNRPAEDAINELSELLNTTDINVEKVDANSAVITAPYIAPDYVRTLEWLFRNAIRKKDLGIDFLVC